MRNKISKGLFGIRKHIFIYISSVVLFAMLCIFAVSNYLLHKNIFEAEKERYRFISENAYAEFKNKYNEIDNITDNWIVSEIVQQSLIQPALTVTEQQKVGQSLALLQSSDVDYYLYIDNHNRVYSQKHMNLSSEDIRKTQIMQAVSGYGKSILYWGEDALFGGEGNYLFIVRYVHNMQADVAPGILCLRMRKEYVEKMFSNNHENNDAVHMLVDAYGNICTMHYSSQLEVSQKALQWIEKQRTQLEPDDKEGLLYVQHDTETGYDIITYVPNYILNSATRTINTVFILLTILVLMIALAVSGIFTNAITKPVIKINEYMQKFDDSRLDKKLNLHTNTELDTIGNSYNAMIGHIAALIDRIYANEKELRDQEIKLLVNQLQPHFLYNTLDNIYMLARISHEETIMHMIYALTSFLRINLSKGAEEIPVAKEIEHVSAYMDIQNIRNNDLFTYEVICPDNLKDVKLCKIILQPLAENAIKHSFDDMLEGGKITIRFSQREKYLHIEFESNGEVISEAAMVRINAFETADIDSMNTLDTDTKGGYGIVNVVKRLRIKYNDDIRFYYTGGETTICVIELPVLEDKKQTAVQTNSEQEVYTAQI